MRGSAFAPDAPLVAGACPPPPPVLPVLAMKLCLVEAGPLRTKLRETATLLPGLRVRGGGRYSGPRTDCSPFSHYYCVRDPARRMNLLENSLDLEHKTCGAKGINNAVSVPGWYCINLPGHPPTSK
jgi:hypothetical protein